MKELIHEDDWLKEVVNEEDVNRWDPRVEECCTADQFKLHLRGTARNAWNVSAARVFTDHFLVTHAELYPNVWAVRRMVLKKTAAYIKSLVRKFRQGNHSEDLRLAIKRAKNRRERKTNVSPRTTLVWSWDSHPL